MSETQYRANYIDGAVDEVEVVSETPGYVDIRIKTGWSGGSIRREGKDTSQTSIHKSKDCALQALRRRAQQELDRANREVAYWSKRWEDVDLQLARVNVDSQTD